MFPSTHLSKTAFLAWVIFLNLVHYSFQGLTQTEIQPLLVTEPVRYDSDDPAIWINKKNPSQSLIVGTDKASDGALYVFDLAGKIQEGKVVRNLRRPNNVDIAYGLKLNGKEVDIAVTTEREASRLRIFSLPDMQPIDGGGIPVFSGEPSTDYRAPMGIALYTKPSTHEIYAVVSRKSGPTNGTYLWQYLLQDDGGGNVTATLVREFGNYSGDKEIESVAVDNELGYIYYSDEGVGVRKYYADPSGGNSELALFATSGFAADHEGISLYKIDDGTGYILVSDQQAGEFHIFTREGAAGNPHDHQLVKVVKVAANLSDGSDLANFPLAPHFPKGLFVAMSDNKTFHLYRWEDIAGSDLKIQLPADAVPSAPALVAPANNATGIALYTALSWQAVSGATAYRLQVAATADFTVMLTDTLINSTSVSLDLPAPGSIYYWRVMAITDGGNSVWSETWTFTTALPTGPLVGRWNMEEGSGSMLRDVSGYGNNATLKGAPGWVAYNSGTALQLNGADQWAVARHTPSLNITQAITLAAWIRPEQRADQYLIYKAGSGETNGYELSLSNAGKVHFRINEESSSNKYHLSSAVAYPTDGNTWMHVAATFDGTVMKLYINGVEEKISSLNVALSILPNSEDLFIGARVNGQNPYKGALDEVRIYNVALSAADIAELAGAVVLTDAPLKGTEETMTVYSNPATSDITVGFMLERSGAYTLDLYDLSGARVSEVKRGWAAARVWNTARVQRAVLARGLYIVRLQAGRSYRTLKLFIAGR